MRTRRNPETEVKTRPTLRTEAGNPLIRSKNIPGFVCCAGLKGGNKFGGGEGVRKRRAETKDDNGVRTSDPYSKKGRLEAWRENCRVTGCIRRVTVFNTVAVQTRALRGLVEVTEGTLKELTPGHVTHSILTRFSACADDVRER